MMCMVLIFSVLLIFLGGGYVIAFYPRQRVKNGPMRVVVHTPKTEVD